MLVGQGIIRNLVDLKRDKENELFSQLALLGFQREAKRGERSGPFSHQLSIALLLCLLFFGLHSKGLLVSSCVLVVFPIPPNLKFMRMCEMKTKLNHQTSETKGKKEKLDA